MTSAVTASMQNNGDYIAPIGGADNDGWKLGYIEIGNKGEAGCWVTIGDVTEVRNAVLSSNSATASIMSGAAPPAEGGKVMDYASNFSANTFLLHLGVGTSSGLIEYR